LLIAEGSDWNWWYGPEHGSDNRPEFDQLYRDHLMNVYRALGLVPPEALSRSILHVEHSGEIHDTPRNSIHVTLDGEVTSYFEWMGAGRYRPDPRSGAMHGAAPPIWEMFYGCDGQSVVLRLDGLDKGVTVEVEFENGIVRRPPPSGQSLQERIAGRHASHAWLVRSRRVYGSHENAVVGGQYANLVRNLSRRKISSAIRRCDDRLLPFEL
jgi:hypothetical protein